VTARHVDFSRPSTPQERRLPGGGSAAATKRSQPVNTSPLNPLPFAKRLCPYLTDDQNDILVSLPPVEASIDVSIVSIARIFIPRARQLAAVTATPWPTDYEHASPMAISSSAVMRR